MHNVAFGVFVLSGVVRDLIEALFVTLYGTHIDACMRKM